MNFENLNYNDILKTIEELYHNTPSVKSFEYKNVYVYISVQDNGLFQRYFQELTYDDIMEIVKRGYELSNKESIFSGIYETFKYKEKYVTLNISSIEDEELFLF